MPHRLPISDHTLIFLLVILLFGGLVFCFGLYWLHIRPLKEHRLNLAQQKWWQAEQARLAALSDDLKARARRLRDMRRHAPEVMKRLEVAFMQLGAMRYWRQDDPLRDKPREQVQRVRFEYCLVDADALIFKLRLPYGTVPHQITDRVFISDLRIESGFPDLEIIPTDRYGLWCRVPARGSRGGIPDIFLWQTSKTRRNAMDILNDTNAHGMVIPVGMASGGRLVTIDITKERDGPSVLGAGRSGAGKSNLLNSMLCTLISRNTPDDLRMYMVDMKHIELMTYENIPHLARPVAMEEADAIGVFDEVLDIMEERQRLFGARGVRKLSTWNEKFPNEKFPYVMVVIDELAMLMASKTKLEGGTVKAQAEWALAKLTAVGRAYGIHCLLFTQRPSVDVITGLIKANVPTRIALTVASPVDSMTIINNGMAAGLDPIGRCILYTGGTYVECQSPLIMDGQIAAVVRGAAKHALPKATATNEHIWDAMLGERWDGIPHFYETAVKDEFNLTFDEFIQWHNGWGYSLPDMGPVIRRGDADYIMVGANLLNVPDGPPRNQKELETIEVMV